MLPEERKAFWKDFSELELIQEDSCWTTCSGGFCCDWRLPEFEFRLIPWGGTVFYLEEEFQYYKDNKKIFPEESIKATSVRFGEGRELKIHYASCQVKDSCRKVVDRTLYCKLYPFLPVFGGDDTVVDLSYISVYDITLDLVGSETPCKVKKLKEKYVDLFNGDKILPFLRDPHVLFNLKAARACSENYVGALTASGNFQANKGREFWRKWEFEYLTGKYIDKGLLAADIKRLHTQIFNQG
jgi:hypothetical protein